MRPRLEQDPEGRLQIDLAQLRRVEIHGRMEVDVRRFEDRFGLQFETLTCFTQQTLKKLHAPGEPIETLLAKPTVLERPPSESVEPEMRTLGRVANQQEISHPDRKAYLNALLSIYEKLPTSPAEHRQDGSVLFVGVQREGRMLGEVLECLPEGHSLTPHAKRIPHEHGLLVGIRGLETAHLYQSCTIIDGAIASGATIVTMMQGLKHISSAFHVFSAHATWEGLRALVRYGLSEGLKVQLTVGSISGGLDDHFYATNPDEPRQLVVGDLGDTIWPIRERTAEHE